MRASSASRCVAGLVLVAASACGSDLRLAPTGRHPVTTRIDAVVVDFPPPPAQVERVSPDPGDPCVWVDGHWEYISRRWQWADGRWVLNDRGCYFAPPVLVWQPIESEHGTLYYTPAQWYDDAGEPCPTPLACVARGAAPRAGAGSASPGQ